MLVWVAEQLSDSDNEKQDFVVYLSQLLLLLEKGKGENKKMMKMDRRNQGCYKEWKKHTCVSCAKLLEPIYFFVVSAPNTNANAVQASMFGKF